MAGSFLDSPVLRITVMSIRVHSMLLVLILLVKTMAAYLNTDLIPRFACYREFLNCMVRRNVGGSRFLSQVPDLGIPPIISRLIWVDQTIAERSLLQNMKDLSPENSLGLMNRLMSCNHFHLAGVIREFVGNDENLTIGEVSKSM
jgi:hypothetical protein